MLELLRAWRKRRREGLPFGPSLRIAAAVCDAVHYAYHERDANDVALTSQVKARMLRDERVPGTKIKVVTEAGVVYLMGLVTKTEAEATTDIARTTSGVAKVVTLFEYLN